MIDIKQAVHAAEKPLAKDLIARIARSACGFATSRVGITWASQVRDFVYVHA